MIVPEVEKQDNGETTSYIFMKKILLPLQNMVRADLFFRQRRICLWHDKFFGSLECARQTAFACKILSGGE